MCRSLQGKCRCVKHKSRTVNLSKLIADVRCETVPNLRRANCPTSWPSKVAAPSSSFPSHEADSESETQGGQHDGGARQDHPRHILAPTTTTLLGWHRLLKLRPTARPRGRSRSERIFTIVIRHSWAYAAEPVGRLAQWKRTSFTLSPWGFPPFSRTGTAVDFLTA